MALGEILDKRQSLKRVLHKEQERLLREDDRALLREMVAGVVRRLPHLDWALEELTTRGLAETQVELVEILRVGAFQILFLDRIPVYAAVDQCVEAAKRINPGAGGFVNGILRSLAERREELAEAAFRFDGQEGLAMREGMPLWLVERYGQRFGAQAEAIISALQRPAKTSIVFPSAAALAQAKILLAREGFALEPDPALPLTFSLKKGDPSKSEAFRRGLFYIMDPASQAPAALLPLKGGERVLDLCAAPGGKSVLLSGRLKEGGWVLATDVNRRRLGMVRENIERLRLANVRLAQVNVEAGLPFGPVWPVVILDAPCSSMGTLRRNPEIRWQVKEEDLARRTPKQTAFLEEAARVVAPDGVLAFSVCSMEPEETSDVVGSFLQAHGEFHPLPIKAPKAWDGFLTPAGSGQAYLLPHRHPWDAFFVAFFRKAKR